MVPTSQQQTTGFLVISDTHGKWPYAEETSPKVDVLLHCWDLTQFGGLPSFKRAMENIKSTDAELKLVIAGNHDLELDEDWVRRNIEESDVEQKMEEVEESRCCVEYIKSLKDFGVHYLEEGVHNFTLKTGRSISIYASPYTPEFHGYAFSYAEDEDRFNDGPHQIPAGVDIVITHGPPQMTCSYRASLCIDKLKDGQHFGCLHCFGHVHEGHGIVRVGWDPSNEHDPSFEEIETGSVYLVKGQKETMILNAAISKEGDKGILVDMNLSG
ncbi:Ser/Thr protein phosphatase family protein [Bimuria novae-zelandiae CBS 107.79]|uniref:Ser/Thr protein phosphatase family protein n=1 Tax=Bimuria novae-zelandiae CBS 107.79 TaxID=1447943 RepID=A0A6A5UW75_9PLEO|nr:Ser/Thr protein phosphatase family protein [Bimuria novae-zelandiae CBS 107.79]